MNQSATIYHASSPRFYTVPSNQRCIHCSIVKTNAELQNHLASLKDINRLGKRNNIRVLGQYPNYTADDIIVKKTTLREIVRSIARSALLNNQ